MSESTQTCETTCCEPTTRATAERTFKPNTDVLRRENEVVLFIDVPGADEDGLDIGIERNQMTVRATVVAESTDRRFSQREYAVGDYVRTFRLADDVDRDGIEATLENGVLRIVLPKSAAVSRKVAVTRR